jgi:hypothetical protein
MKVVLSACEEGPEEGKLRRGSSVRWSKPLLFATDSRVEKSPEGGHRDLEPMALDKTSAKGRGAVQTTGGQRRATSPYGFSRGEDPEERTLDVAAG